MRSVFRTFSAHGGTRHTRFELGRVLFRSTASKIMFSLIGSEYRITNYLDTSLIRVSSYQLQTSGIRLDAYHRFQRGRSNISISWEAGAASGPAAHLPAVGQASIADNRHSRWQVFSGMDWVLPANLQLNVKLNGQYSRDLLFPVVQFSLLSAGVVEGYSLTSFTGNSALHAGLELGYRVPGRSAFFQVLPFAGLDAGWVGNRANESRAGRVVSVCAGIRLTGAAVSLEVRHARPLQQYATVLPSSAAREAASVKGEWLAEMQVSF